MPATCARFYGGDGEMVLLASEDSTLRAMSVWRDTKHFSLVHEYSNSSNCPNSLSYGTAGRMRQSEAKKRKIDLNKNRLEHIVRIASDTVHENDWDNGAASISICISARYSRVRARGQLLRLHLVDGQEAARSASPLA